MPIGSRKPKKKKAKQTLDLPPNVAAAITEAAFLAASADGEVSEGEFNLIASLMVELFDGITEDNVLSLLGEFSGALQEEGFEGRLDVTVNNLPDEDAQAAALLVVATLILSDEEYDPDSEGAFYDDLAEKLGFDEERAAEIWNARAEDFGWA